MSLLKDILYRVAIESIKGTTEIAVRNIQFDSRIVGLDDVFVAIKGTVSDGHEFIERAVNQGAIAIVCEEFPERIVNGISYIKVQDSQAALAYMASNFYGNPSSKLQLVGVTGTNGKTTVASLLYELYKKAGFKTGLLSTVKVKINDISYPATHTTPNSLSLNMYLNEMVENGVEYCFMEVSSHGIHQRRILGLHFTGGIFTNLSHDHLDYHKTFAEYRDVKKAFFDHLPKTAFAITNVDDKNGSYMVQNAKAKVCSYALKSMADYKAQILENQITGLQLRINGQEVWIRLIGSFNAYNALAIYATATELGMEAMEVLRILSELESVAGRFQFFISNQKITAIVDYAHTPDALQNIISTLNEIRTNNEKLITVVGCGGNRDITKRPIMASIATSLSNQTILTSDNPRFEDPQTIIDEMEQGVEPMHFKKYISVLDRKQAIKTACQMANPDDIILIAGKGHEDYQEIQGVKYHFDDLETVREILIQLNK